MPKNRWWQWLAGGLLGLLLLTLLTRCGGVQDDIQSRAQSLLNDNGMEWATVNLQNRGRDALLTGEAPNESARDEAINSVRNLYGTRVVDHDITLKKYVSSTFGLKRTDDSIILSGTLPDQATIDQTANEIQQLYGTDNVTNNLVASDDASAPKWLAGVTAMLPALVAARNIDLSADDDAIKISGDVETAELRDEALGVMNNAFGDKLQAVLDVVKTGPTEEELAAIAAEEARKAAAAEEAKRLEAARIAAEEEKARLAAEAEAAKLAEEEARLAAEAEAARKAAEEEKARLTAEAEAAKKAAEAEKARLAAEAAAAKKAAEEKARLAAEAAAAKKAAEEEKARLAAEAQQRQLLAMQQHQMMLAQQRRKIVIVQSLAPVQYDPETMKLPPGKPLSLNNNQAAHMIGSCENALNRLVSTHPPIFSEDSAELLQGGQNLFAQLNVQLRLCGAVVQQAGMHIKVTAGSQRAAAAVRYLQDDFSIPPGLLRVNTEADTANSNTQLHFTITQ